MTHATTEPRAAPAPTRGAWARDLPAGLVVALVALPLCLGIALASGAPLMAGLITGAIGGLVVSWAGGTHLLVSGPAAGLTVIVLAAVGDLGFPGLLAATTLAGLLQLGLGALRAGRLAAFVPSAVVTGMLAAIGLLLVLQQSPHLLGAALDARVHGLALLSLPWRAAAGATAGPALIGLSALAALAAWQLPAVAPLARRVPGPLAAVLVGVALAEALPHLAPALALGPASRVALPDVSAGPLALLTAPDLGALGSAATWQVAVTLAVVASLETLLSLQATDRLDPWKRRSDADRELLGQGLGNTLAGLVGGLPMTGVIVRSAANVDAGGRTWRSAFVHGVLLVAAVLAVPHLLERIPLAALAAILVHTGFKLAHPRQLAEALRAGRSYAIPFVATIALVVLTDLLVGVLAGVAVSALMALAANARHGLEVEASSGSHRVRLARAVCFVHKPSLEAALEAVPPGADLTVDGTATRAIDPDVLEILTEFDATARERGIRYRLLGVHRARVPAAH